MAYSIITPVASERSGYPTQKPEQLLECVIQASSNPDDLVFDRFMGTGATQTVTMRLVRRFSGADINRRGADRDQASELPGKTLRNRLGSFYAC